LQGLYRSFHIVLPNQLEIPGQKALPDKSPTQAMEMRSKAKKLRGLLARALKGFNTGEGCTAETSANPPEFRL
jgi:hypothetical protein